MQGTSNTLVDGNTIFNATPLQNMSEGVIEAPGPGSAGGIEANNVISNNTVNDRLFSRHLRFQQPRARSDTSMFFTLSCSAMASLARRQRSRPSHKES